MQEVKAINSFTTYTKGNSVSFTCRRQTKSKLQFTKEEYKNEVRTGRFHCFDYFRHKFP